MPCHIPSAWGGGGRLSVPTILSFFFLSFLSVVRVVSGRMTCNCIVQYYCAYCTHIRGNVATVSTSRSFVTTDLYLSRIEEPAQTLVVLDVDG